GSETPSREPCSDPAPRPSDARDPTRVGRAAHLVEVGWLLLLRYGGPLRDVVRLAAPAPGIGTYVRGPKGDHGRPAPRLRKSGVQRAPGLPHSTAARPDSSGAIERPGVP